MGKNQAAATAVAVAAASTADSSKKSPEKRTYIVRSTPILHNGERYEPGASIELTEAQAKDQDVKLAKAGDAESTDVKE